MEAKDSGIDFHMGEVVSWPTPLHHKKNRASSHFMGADYGKLRELLLAQEKFPLDYLHKFIGRNSDAFSAGLADWAKCHPAATCQADRLSANQGHRSVTYIFRAPDVDALIAMLQATDRIPDLVMIL